MRSSHSKTLNLIKFNLQRRTWILVPFAILARSEKHNIKKTAVLLSLKHGLQVYTEMFVFVPLKVLCKQKLFELELNFRIIWCFQTVFQTVKLKAFCQVNIENNTIDKDFHSIFKWMNVGHFRLRMEWPKAPLSQHWYLPFIKFWKCISCHILKLTTKLPFRVLLNFSSNCKIKLNNSYLQLVNNKNINVLLTTSLHIV